MKPKPCKVTYTKGKGWRECGKGNYYSSFALAQKLSVNGKGKHPVKGEIGYVTHKLGGVGGAIETLLFGNLPKKIVKEERSYLQALERRKLKIQERKAQKRLTFFGLKPPVKKSQYVPYAFRV
jgi:hypothetical protein